MIIIHESCGKLFVGTTLRQVEIQSVNPSRASPRGKENRDIIATIMSVDVAAAAKRAGGVKKGGLAVLVIDQQVDFHPGGSLAIPTLCLLDK